MAVDPLTAGFEFATSLLGVANPFITKYLYQENQNDYNDFIAEYNKIMSASPRNADDLRAYIMRLYNRSGKTAGSLGNEATEIPVRDLDFLIERANLCNLLIAAINQMQYQQNNQKE